MQYLDALICATDYERIILEIIFVDFISLPAKLGNA